MCTWLCCTATHMAMMQKHGAVCRLDMLQAQCELWSGPIAAVVYVPLLHGMVVSMDDASVNGTTRDAQHDRLALFHDRVTKEGVCLSVSAPG